MSGKIVLRSILLFDIGAIIFALIIGNPPEQHFGEMGFITYLSFFQLLVVAWLSWKIFAARYSSEPRPGVLKAPFFIWLIVAAAFVYFALDEILMIHERLDLSIHQLFKIEETYLTDRIDDAIVASYGLLMLLVLYLYRDELRGYKSVFPLLKVGAIFAFLMVISDFLTNNVGFIEDVITISDSTKASWMWLGSIEDMFKIVAEGIFIAVFHRCLKIARQRIIFV